MLACDPTGLLHGLWAQRDHQLDSKEDRQGPRPWEARGSKRGGQGTTGFFESGERLSNSKGQGLSVPVMETHARPLIKSPVTHEGRPLKYDV